MYTRCPECRTPFRITRAQLAARAGLVRCGRCDAVFRAHEQLLEPPVSSPAARAGDGQSPKRRRRKSAYSATHASRRSNDPGIPTISEFSFASKPRRLHPAVWGILNLALFLGLAGQVVFFYRNDLVRYPAIEPLIGELCRVLEWRIELPAPPLPELSETTIAPHPRFANGLRIRAVMVNRTAAALPYPLMEVNLTDSNGSVLARRAFESRQYLENPAGAGVRLQPNVAINALIDLVNPDGKAVGYEIQLVRPNETGSN